MQTIRLNIAPATARLVAAARDWGRACDAIKRVRASYSGCKVRNREEGTPPCAQITDAHLKEWGIEPGSEDAQWCEPCLEALGRQIPHEEIRGYVKARHLAQQRLRRAVRVFEQLAGQDALVAYQDPPWSTERPTEEGRDWVGYWVSLHPRERDGSKYQNEPIEVDVRGSEVWRNGRLWRYLGMADLAGAQWKRRLVPADPFKGGE